MILGPSGLGKVGFAGISMGFFDILALDKEHKRFIIYRVLMKGAVMYQQYVAFAKVVYPVFLFFGGVLIALELTIKYSDWRRKKRTERAIAFSNPK